MGRELARQLAAEGAHVAICDVSDENMQKTRELSLAGAPDGVRVSTHVCDVSDEQQVLAFRTGVVDAHDANHVNLLFNNAGIGGGGTITDPGVREEWERTFDVCWYGVYYTTLAFLPLLQAADEARLVNTSSVNGFWASLGPTSAHSAYSTAKFAVKGFTEALLNDFRNNAPNVKVSLVMPGHIGTDIVINSNRMLGRDPKEMTDDQLDQARERMVGLGLPVENATNEQLRAGLAMVAEGFRDNAPMTAAEAATVILDGVRAERWRILVGKDAEVLDRLVRETPEEAYTEEFMARLTSETAWGLGS
jgi:NAD(P)-dependent dehydrogenase (short-subunit alcohol dehydrogenase family)